MLNCVMIVLQPRFFVHKKLQKNRKFLSPKLTPSLVFGNSGLLLLRPTLLTSNHISRFKLFLKKAVRKPDKTKRFFWFNVFPHLPLTRKVTGSRMGKGKGKLSKWFTVVTTGTVLTEFTNLRYGRAKYFMKQLTFKLGIPTRFLFINSFFFPSYFSQRKRVFFRIFW